MKLTESVMREVARELKPTWSDEQFEAHWQNFLNLKASVARGRRKQAQKSAKKQLLVNDGQINRKKRKT